MRFLDYFDNFLKSKRKYVENQAFWRLAIAIWCEEEFEESFSTNDGNPILYVFFPNLQKSFKIIQLVKNDNNIPFSVNLEKSGMFDGRGEELVLTLQLNRDTYHDTEKIFKSFIANQLDDEKIVDFTTKYLINW
jgi:hypothetical protein